MEIRLPVSNLRTALAGVAKIVPLRLTLPIDAQVRVRRSANGVVDIQGTKLDTFGTFRFSDQPGESGVLLVPLDVLVRSPEGAKTGILDRP